MTVSDEESAEEPKILDDRFALSDEKRPGGMAWVQKAMDTQSGSLCAIKRMKPLHDEMLAKESFYRELRALESLRHPNIVEMIGCGIDAKRQPYIALEWVDDNLENYVKLQRHPMRWTEFWPKVGRPVLDAICFAQTRRFLHRDIKPRNILITSSGVPKVSDYGISRLGDRDENPAPGRPTFRDHGSKPYTPPEQDDGTASVTRDGFSWVVLALYCMTGEEPSDYGAISAVIDQLADVPREILRRASSISPADRPPYASVLLAELDEWEEARRAGTPGWLLCHVFLEYPVQMHLTNVFGPEETDPVGALVEDLNEVIGVRASPDDPNMLRLVGASWQLVVRRNQVRPEVLVGERAIRLGPAEAERQREVGWSGSIKVLLSEPVDRRQASAALDELFAEAHATEQERAARWAIDPDRIFRAWNAYLRARLDFETGRVSALRYSECRVSGRQVTLTVSDSIPPDLHGQDRIIRVGQRYVFVTVVAVLGDEVTLEATVGDLATVPRKGFLEVNTRRAELAIERQRQALDAVMYRRAANVSLRDIITAPNTATPPLSGQRISEPGKDFDADKKAVLAKALGVQDVLTVEGPPGTGKTRLIEEIIVQYLDRNPRYRVLLSSQTHVALDNVIERVRRRSPGLDIVRVGRFDDPKIAASASDLLLERKADSWSERVSAKAREWLSEWATQHGVDPSDVDAGLTTLRLSRLLRDEAKLRGELKHLEDRARAIADVAAERLASLAMPSTETELREEKEATVSATELRSKLASMSDEERTLRERLSSLSGYRRELAGCADPTELEEYAEMLLAGGEAHDRCRQLMQLQESWLERVGRSTDFHAAMLASANVVAATCVGLASVRGMAEVVFDLCIVDEASKATATEVLVPLSRSRRSILVGDPKQLPPFFERGILAGQGVAEFSEKELRENVFDRLLGALPERSRARLEHQYRMARPIGELVSTVFYEGKLRSPIEKPNATFLGFPKLVTWLDTSHIDGCAEEEVRTSFQNSTECRVIRSVLKMLAFTASKRKNVTYEVAVIAGYQAQVKAIESAIRDQRHAWPELQIRVNTVDAFQGSEAEVCIYSVVRSNDKAAVGFLREPPRLNVALSRGRSLLAIVGDYRFCSVLSSITPMTEIVRYIEDHPDDCEVRSADDA
jgi:serine/threonine protein kinase